jgi:hypothetical protein
MDRFSLTAKLASLAAGALVFALAMTPVLNQAAQVMA